MSPDTFARVSILAGIGLFTTLWFFHEDLETLALYSWYPRKPGVARLLNRRGGRVLWASAIMQCWSVVVAVAGGAVAVGVVSDAVVPSLQQVAFIWGGLVASGLVLVLAAAERFG